MITKLCFACGLIAISLFQIGLNAGDSTEGTAVSPMQQVFLIKQLKPELARIGILCDLSQRPELPDRLQRISAQLGVKIIIKDTHRLKNVLKNFKFLVYNQAAEVVWIFPDKVLIHPSARRYLIKEAVSARVLLIAPDSDMVEKGATLFVEKNADQIKVHLNSKAMELLGLDITPQLMSSAEVLVK